MSKWELHHVAHGKSLLRVTEQCDLISDPELWQAVYFENRHEVLEAHGPECPAARRFEPDLLDDDDEDDDSEEDEF